MLQRGFDYLWYFAAVWTMFAQGETSAVVLVMWATGYVPLARHTHRQNGTLFTVPLETASNVRQLLKKHAKPMGAPAQTQQVALAAGLPPHPPSFSSPASCRPVGPRCWVKSLVGARAVPVVAGPATLGAVGCRTPIWSPPAATALAPMGCRGGGRPGGLEPPCISHQRSAV